MVRHLGLTTSLGKRHIYRDKRVPQISVGYQGALGRSSSILSLESVFKSSFHELPTHLGSGPLDLQSQQNTLLPALSLSPRSHCLPLSLTLSPS